MCAKWQATPYLCSLPHHCTHVSTCPLTPHPHPPSLPPSRPPSFLPTPSHPFSLPPSFLPPSFSPHLTLPPSLHPPSIPPSFLPTPSHPSSPSLSPSPSLPTHPLPTPLPPSVQFHMAHIHQLMGQYNQARGKYEALLACRTASREVLAWTQKQLGKERERRERERREGRRV